MPLGSEVWGLNAQLIPQLDSAQLDCAAATCGAQTLHLGRDQAGPACRREQERCTSLAGVINHALTCIAVSSPQKLILAAGHGGAASICCSGKIGQLGPTEPAYTLSSLPSAENSRACAAPCPQLQRSVHELHMLPADPRLMRTPSAWRPLPDRVLLGADVHCAAWAPSTAAAKLAFLAVGAAFSLLCSSWCALAGLFAQPNHPSSTQLVRTCAA